MAIKYSQAPISEVTCGIFFKSSILANGAIFFELLAQLKTDYPSILTSPTSAEEEVISGSIHANPNYERAGFAAYRFATSDNRWQVVVQQNMFSFHWVRQDAEAVGNYPGFAEIYRKFRLLLDTVKKYIGGDSSFFNSIKACYLAYLDRIEMRPFTERGENIKNILTLTPPGFSVNGRQYFANNYFARYSTPCEEVDGYSIMSINSPTLPFGQILIVDNKIKGHPSSIDKVDEWFDVAHGIQLSFFESTFTPQTLQYWR